jgi:predicted PurR-regulated permease PerM
LVGIIAAVLAGAAVYHASSVLAPLALAFFIIALVWPLQSELQQRLPKLAAVAIVLLVTVAAGGIFASLVAWGFGRVGRALIVDAARYQALYEGVVAWLDGHGISLATIWAEHFNVGWLLRAAQQITGRINTTLTFWLVALIYVVLGLLEVGDVDGRLRALGKSEAARVLRQGSMATAARLRRYMLVRTQMSLLTGLLVAAFAAAVGLPFATEWGVIAFALNYIPFIGPFLATLFPTLLAITQFESWQAMLAVFACLNVIQFVVGSYIEPRLAGSILSISPFLVLLSVFFWTWMWGLFGAFIGVPITIAALAFCEQHPSSRWVAELFGAARCAEKTARGDA